MPDLLSLITSGWKIILGGALAAVVLAFVYTAVLVPSTYTATATLVISQSALVEEESEPASPAYQALLESDSVLRQTRERLVSAGVVSAEEPLRLGRELQSEVVVEGRGRSASFARVITAVAVAEDAEKASRIANTWAEVFVEQSQALGPGRSPAAETLFEGHLTPTRSKIDALEAERIAVLKDYSERSEAIHSKWDSRIEQLKKQIDGRLAEYRAATRLEMEEVLESSEEWLNAQVESGQRSRVYRTLLELVSVRSQLAQSPLVREHARESSFADVLSPDGGLQPADSKVLSLDTNPLYDQLTLRALDLEDELQEAATDDLDTVASVLAGIERVQYEREAGLSTLLQSQELKLGEMLRRKRQELDQIERQRDSEMASLWRRLDQLTGLEKQLADKHSTSVLEQVLGAMETVKLAARAVPPELADSRRIPLKVSLGAIVGALLGLLVALFR